MLPWAFAAGSLALAWAAAVAALRAAERSAAEEWERAHGRSGRV